MTSNPTATNNILQQQEKLLRENDPDLRQEGAFVEKMEESPSNHAFVPLGMQGRTHVVTPGSQALLQSITLADLQHMTELFYEKAFGDQTLDTFIRSHDDPHGARFAKWIY